MDRSPQMQLASLAEIAQCQPDASTDMHTHVIPSEPVFALGGDLQKSSPTTISTHYANFS